MAPGDAWREAGIIVERDVPVPMRDGVTLRANIYRPTDGRPAPVLLLRLPYDKEIAQSYVYAHPAWYVRRGYGVVTQDTRGRGASEDDFYPLRHDDTDGYDTIEWCASLPWSNGRVGTYGFSHPGSLSCWRRRSDRLWGTNIRSNERGCASARLSDPTAGGALKGCLFRLVVAVRSD